MLSCQLFAGPWLSIIPMAVDSAAHFKSLSAFRKALLIVGCLQDNPKIGDKGKLYKEVLGLIDFWIKRGV
jgi:hypothetical protein